MTRLVLREFSTEGDVALTVEQREALRAVHPGLRISPAPFSTDRYDLTPDQRVGLITIPGMSIEIRPKIPMTSVLFLVSYACDAAAWFDQQPEFAEDVGFAEVIAVMLARLVEGATRRGLLHGYRSTEESLTAPRGRILFDEQLRRRVDRPVPIEVRHDVFTADVLENRLLSAALSVLARIGLQSSVAKREVVRAQRLFGEVARVSYRRTKVPDVTFTRLNRHYQPALSLATLVLRSASLELGAGKARGSALLIDMNKVFEQFVRISLRKALKTDARAFPDRPPAVRLDEAGAVPLRPDLCLVESNRIRWVGDAKYKKLPAGAYTNADLYQSLAYTIALGLSECTLIYAADEGVSSAEYVVRRAGKRLRVVTLDLAAPPQAVLRQVGVIAEGIGGSARPARAIVA